MEKRFVVALDQGTTSSRSVLVDRSGAIVASAQHPFEQLYPKPGWVEHRPEDIVSSQLGTLTELLVASGVHPGQIEAIGITNQRETTVVWDRATGRPVYNAIVWQCRRTAGLVEQLCARPGIAADVRARTGLTLDAYFSASKVRWILDNVPGARERALKGDLAFGTVDSWLLWSLTDGEVHATDPTNASRTMLYNIHEGRWDERLLELFDIPASMMPEVRPSSGSFGFTAHPSLPQGIPVCGMVGDQQSALFGQCCFDVGQAKCTYGTGAFMLMNTGREACVSKNNLVTTIAACPPGTTGIEYALEGSVFVAGALVQWLRDELGLVRSAAQTEELALSVPDTNGVHVVPAFTGLGAPYWDADARGAILGLTRGAGRAHIVRAALEAMAYQVCDLARAMQADAGAPFSVLNVDGGASANGFLMQFQADMLGCRVRRPLCVETTALGAAYLAGLACGFWSGTDELRGLRTSDDVFAPQLEASRADALYEAWLDAVARVRSNR